MALELQRVSLSDCKALMSESCLGKAPRASAPECLWHCCAFAAPVNSVVSGMVRIGVGDSHCFNV